MPLLLKITFVFGFIVFPLSSHSAFILQIKRQQALIHLEGLKTKKGSYFEILDLYGTKKGIIQIQRTGHQKAIGTLKLGKMGKRWSLEPISKSKAIAAQKKAKTKAKIALYKKAKTKAKKWAALIKKLNQQQRIIAQHKNMARKKKIRKRRRPQTRSVASYQKEYIATDHPQKAIHYQSPHYQSREVLLSKSEVPYTNEDEYYNVPDTEFNPQNQDEWENQHRSRKQSSFFSKLTVGLSPRVEYNFMNVKPPREPGYFMKGLRYSIFSFMDYSVNRVISIGSTIGFREFYVFAHQGLCGRRGGDCFLDIDYIVGGLNIKFNIEQFNGHQLWLSLEGYLMHLMNKRPPMQMPENSLTDSSFYGLHGMLGGAIGVNFKFGAFIVPVALRANIMPPTREILIGNAGLEVGLAYKL